MDSILRYISSQDLCIEYNWGRAQFEKIQMLRSLGVDLKENFSQEKAASSAVDYYNSKGKFLGRDLEFTNNNSIASVSLSGVMMLNDGFCHRGVKSLATQLQALYEDPAVSGIIIDADTGGGQAAAGDWLMNAIADKNKPVIVYTTFLASAGIKMSLPADAVIAASNATPIGSIGVMINISKKNLLESREDNPEGVKTVYSRTSKNKNKEIRAAIEGNFDPFEDYVTSIDEVFMAQVREYRTLRGSKARQEETLSGGMFLAHDAKKRGLIDGVGTKKDVFKIMNKQISFYNK